MSTSGVNDNTCWSPFTAHCLLVRCTNNDKNDALCRHRELRALQMAHMADDQPMSNIQGQVNGCAFAVKGMVYSAAIATAKQSLKSKAWCCPVRCTQTSLREVRMPTLHVAAN